MVDDHGSSHDDPFVNGKFTEFCIPMITVWTNIMCGMNIYLLIVSNFAFGVDIFSPSAVDSQ